MSITTVTGFHATRGEEDALLELQTEGRWRMLAADGCQSFEILRDQADGQSFVFVQSGHPAKLTTQHSASSSLPADT
jgi:quinol monooxygenase YgiN